METHVLYNMKVNAKCCNKDNFQLILTPFYAIYLNM